MADFVLSDEEQQVVEEGEAARFLLTHPDFLRVIEKVRADCAEAILTSDPQAKEAREDAYNLSRGLSAITLELDALVSRADAILAQAETLTLEDHQPDVPESDY